MQRLRKAVQLKLLQPGHPLVRRLFVQFTGLLGLGKIYGTPLTTEGIEDRVYRLHYNEGQNRTDTFSRIGAAAGAAAAAAKFGLSKNTIIGGAAFGTSLAVLTHVATFEGAEKGLKSGPGNLANELRNND